MIVLLFFIYTFIISEVEVHLTKSIVLLCFSFGAKEICVQLGFRSARR